jgi:hypothetical protein
VQQDRLLHRDALRGGFDMELWERVLGFMDAQAVLTAHTCGIFEVLGQGPAAGAEIAARIQLPVSSCERLLALLAALELLDRLPDGRYANAPEAQERLVSSSPGYVGGLLSYVRTVLYPAWGRLDSALAEMAPQCHAADGTNPQETMFDDPQRLGEFLAGMHTITYQSACVVAAAAPEIRRLGTLVDVGGGSGAFLIAAAEQSPAQRGVLFDLPPVVALAQKYIARAGMGERISTQAGDFWRDPLPENADGYVLGFILHDWDDRGGDMILDKVASAAHRGATLIVGEQLLAPERTAPLFAVRQDVNMLVSARGRERSESEYREWIGRHGFLWQQTYPAPYGKHYMFACRL